MTDDSLWTLRLIEERFHRDDEGRPVREGRTPAEYLRPDDIEWRQCPYPGSRHLKLPMNVSALRQMSAHWDDMLATLGFLRLAYTEARGGYANDLMDIWRVSHLGSALPWYFILNGRPCPAYAAALSKATLGTGLWASKLLAKMREGWRPPARFTAQSMLELAEQTGTLLAETEVCSGPERMLLRFFDVFVEDTFPTECPLAAERERVLRFGAHYLGFKQMLWIYCSMRRFLLADCRAVLGERVDLVELLASPCEPPDFVTLEPPAPATVPRPVRTLWFRALADMLVSLAPDASDRALLDIAHRMADAIGEQSPPQLDSIAGEVALVVSDPHSVEVIARAAATYCQLDTLFGEAMAVVEAGMRSTPSPAIPAACRDRAQLAPPRQFFASFAPRAVERAS